MHQAGSRPAPPHPLGGDPQVGTRVRLPPDDGTERLRSDPSVRLMVYPSAVNLSEEERSTLAPIEEIDIETRAADGTVRRSIIWVVVDGDDVFIRSVRGDVALWYREAVADSQVTLIADGQRIDVLLVAADDPDSIERCSAGLQAKYSADSALPTMLVAKTLPTTMRVVAPG